MQTMSSKICQITSIRERKVFRPVKLASLDDEELSLKDWQDAKPMTLDQACTFEQFHRSRELRERRELSRPCENA